MYLISACLIGENVKYDGTNNVHQVAKALYESGQAIPVCPEVLGGLSTPRIPSEIVNDQVVSKAGVNVTPYFQLGAQKTLETALKHNVKTAILQERSPSCGVHKIYNGQFDGTLIDGQGVTTSLLEQHGIRVITIDEFIQEQHETD